MSENEVTEDLVELAQDVKNLTEDLWLTVTRTQRRRVIIGGTSLLFGVGVLSGAGGWLLASKKLKTKYELLAEQEIADAKEFYKILNKKDEFSSPESTVESLDIKPEVREGLEEAATALLRYQGSNPNSLLDSEGKEVLVEEEVIVRTSVFERDDSGDEREGTSELSEEDRENRPLGGAYIIGHEEFLAADTDNAQVTLTYYSGDMVLVDEQDAAIPDWDPLVGKGTLDRFGYGSDSSRSVYVRNERLNLDMEIVKHDGRYSHEVLGLQHSDEQARRDRRKAPIKFRGGDE